MMATTMAMAMAVVFGKMNMDVGKWKTPAELCPKVVLMTCTTGVRVSYVIDMVISCFSSGRSRIHEITNCYVKVGRAVGIGIRIAFNARSMLSAVRNSRKCQQRDLCCVGGGKRNSIKRAH